MGVRLHTPTTGRFLQVDPVVGGNVNSYEYCHADPINCVDLDGRSSGPWELYKLIVGVWVISRTASNYLSHDTAEFINQLLTGVIYVDWQYTGYGEARNSMRIERAIDVSYVCTKRNKAGSCLRTKTQTQTRWRYNNTTTYRAMITASARIWGTSIRKYWTSPFFYARRQSDWIYRKPSAEFL
jgi:hypothetical protein